MKKIVYLGKKIIFQMTPNSQGNVFNRVWRFYIDGFREMTVGRKLWLIIIIKVIILFGVFKLFFFPNLLQRDYDTDNDRARAVGRELINRTAAEDDSN